MDLGTGKITKEEMKDIPHHMLDIRDPSEDFSVEEFQKLAFEKIDEIISRGKTPIICGGTGFFHPVNNGKSDIPECSSKRKASRELKRKSEELKSSRKIPKEDGCKIDLENKAPRHKSD